MDYIEINGRIDKVATILTEVTPLDHRFCQRIAKLIVMGLDTPASGTPIPGFDQGAEKTIDDDGAHE